MIDLTKLTPPPWTAREVWPGWFDLSGPNGRIFDCNEFDRHGEGAKDDALFCAMARNAFSVMTRRGWEVRNQDDLGWCAVKQSGWPVDASWINNGNSPTLKRFWPDPFTAIVEADRWYKENVENTRP